jgi:hypothetical protein
MEFLILFYLKMPQIWVESKAHLIVCYLKKQKQKQKKSH